MVIQSKATGLRVCIHFAQLARSLYVDIVIHMHKHHTSAQKEPCLASKSDGRTKVFYTHKWTKNLNNMFLKH